MGNLTQPTSLHLVCALAWRGWFLAWRMLSAEAEDMEEEFWLKAEVQGATARFDVLEQRWPVVRRMVLRGLPLIDADALAADLHNEAAAMLRLPLPSVSVPSPILGLKTRELMVAIEVTPPYFWKLSDEELIAYFDHAAPLTLGLGGQEDRLPKIETSIQRQAALVRAEDQHVSRKEGTDPLLVEFMSALDLARHLRIDSSEKDAMESFLRRYRKKFPDCFREVEGNKRSEPRYLYRTKDILPELSAWLTAHRSRR